MRRLLQLGSSPSRAQCCAPADGRVTRLIEAVEQAAGDRSKQRHPAAADAATDDCRRRCRRRTRQSSCCCCVGRQASQVPDAWCLLCRLLHPIGGQPRAHSGRRSVHCNSCRCRRRPPRRVAITCKTTGFTRQTQKFTRSRVKGFAPSASENGNCSEGACSSPRSSPPSAALHGLTPCHG